MEVSTLNAKDFTAGVVIGLAASWSITIGLLSFAEYKYGAPEQTANLLFKGLALPLTIAFIVMMVQHLMPAEPNPWLARLQAAINSTLSGEQLKTTGLGNAFTDPEGTVSFYLHTNWLGNAIDTEGRLAVQDLPREFLVVVKINGITRVFWVGNREPAKNTAAFANPFTASATLAHRLDWDPKV